MTEDIIGRLRQNSMKQEPMVPTTVRIHPDTEAEIKDFCAEHKIVFAVCVREIIDRGWESVQETAAPKREIAG